MLFDDDNLIFESSQVLKRINESKNYKKPLHEQVRDAKNKIDTGRLFFEEYDVCEFKNKMKIDLMLFEQLLQKLDSEQTLQVEPIISKLYNKVREIYEFTNINPEIFGRLTTAILSESAESAKSILSKHIYTFLDNKFYNLPVSRRDQKYKDKIGPISSQLMTEGVECKEAVEFALKTCISQELIESICFPFSIKSRLDYLLENEGYAEIFDQDKLKGLYESYLSTVRNISKIIASCV